ncbi:sigma factor-like helix-turn-helix DNA-binding protein [Priestia megaterium]|uniref:sigma factor-like helix-turn-helix DNA-binding protein n=1 Tax=Priestia megaterium TaxID=1404 RepID=UPI002E24948A|nr:sigma factor-like helix-turn-helix DNA-binding protein [Priestia megaterium]MED3932946.1 sigma factor-like helix-turn-helix DNA-binding protein [Priestia megaterium]
MRDLIIQYRYLVTNLRKEQKELLEQKKKLMSALYKERKKSDSNLEKMEELEAEIALNETISSQKGEIISEREYDIEWMETGRRPGNKRGAERRSKYQRALRVDPNRFLNMAYVEPEVKTEKELDILEDQVLEILWDVLTKSERNLYFLAYAYGYSESEIAETTKLTYENVKATLGNARRKIKQNREKIEKRFKKIKDTA